MRLWWPLPRPQEERRVSTSSPFGLSTQNGRSADGFASSARTGQTREGLPILEPPITMVARDERGLAGFGGSGRDGTRGESYSQGM